MCLCNMCGNEIGQNQYGYLNDHIKIEKRWEYGAKFDNEVHILNICEVCYCEFLKQLKKSPKIENNLQGYHNINIWQ